jgi:hypothetical protein
MKLEKWKIRRIVTGWPFWPEASLCRPGPKAKTAQVAQLAGAARCAQHAVTARVARAVARLSATRWWTRGNEVLGGAPVERGGGAEQGGCGRCSPRAAVRWDGGGRQWSSDVSLPAGFSDGRRRPGRGPAVPGEREG